MTALPRFEYKTEVLTSFFGREKMRRDALDDCLNRNGWDGWELVKMEMSTNIKGQRDGHLLIFKRTYYR